MVTSGGTMSGNCATGSVSIEMAPKITVRMAITIATIGRLMKNLDMAPTSRPHRSEEHTSELQSLRHLVCRLLLEKKKKKTKNISKTEKEQDLCSVTAQAVLL